MEKRTGYVGGSIRAGLTRLTHTYQKQLTLLGAAVSGYVMASSYIFGGVSPFGVAFCATLSAPHSMFAALGAILGYTFSGALTNMKYLAAVLLVMGLQWLAGTRVKRQFSTAAASVMTLIALTMANITILLVADAVLYDIILGVAEVFLGAGSAYFFARSLRAVQSGWRNVNRSDVSCLIVSFAVVVMGFGPITIGKLSVGRILCALAILLCARAGGEAGGAISGITAGIAMGLSGGDYAYAISAYGFGGLLSGVFSNMGRIATAGSFIIVNALAALFTKSTGDVYTSMMEIFVATVIFILLPQSMVNQLHLARLGRGEDSDATAQNALRGRLGEISGALQDISFTTREVGKRLSKLEGATDTVVRSRVAERVCTHCGMKDVCWGSQEDQTSSALTHVMSSLKREGSINRDRMPKYFIRTCCKLDDFILELNTQFHDYVAKQGTQRKVSRVRAVVTDQFDGMAMMLDEISGELCEVTLLDAGDTRKVREYFQLSGYTVQQMRCYKDEFSRITVEATFPAFQLARLEQAEPAVDLSELLEVELDQPYISHHQQSITAAFTEQATFRLEIGAHQIPPEGNRLCGDAYETIPNRSGKAHLILSDGMGSGGGAAVDSHMATGLLSRLISVGFSHEAALKMVNSALLIKSGEESLATIDICTLDLYTGHTEFFKAGAAPTYVVRGGRAGIVDSTSLPAGILQGVDFEKSTMTLREADIVVLISDGVIADSCQWVLSELESLQHTDMQTLAEKLCMTAKIRRSDGREDDITVVAAALRKGV